MSIYGSFESMDYAGKTALKQHWVFGLDSEQDAVVVCLYEVMAQITFIFKKTNIYCSTVNQHQSPFTR